MQSVQTPAKTSVPRREPKLKQPLEIINIPDALLQKSTVVAITALSPSSIDRQRAAGRFPQPIKDGTRCTRWRAGDVMAWLRNQAAKAEAVAA